MIIYEVLEKISAQKKKEKYFRILSAVLRLPRMQSIAQEEVSLSHRQAFVQRVLLRISTTSVVRGFGNNLVFLYENE